jgi:hypothetical protein
MCNPQTFALCSALHFEVPMKTLALLLSLTPIATADDDLTKWPISIPITMNTSESGANIKGDVAEYPVALALSAENFDFTQAKPDGSDLRFSLEYQSQREGQKFLRVGKSQRK